MNAKIIIPISFALFFILNKPKKRNNKGAEVSKKLQEIAGNNILIISSDARKANVMNYITRPDKMESVKIFFSDKNREFINFLENRVGKTKVIRDEDREYIINKSIELACLNGMGLSKNIKPSKKLNELYSKITTVEYYITNHTEDLIKYSGKIYNMSTGTRGEIPGLIPVSLFGSKFLIADQRLDSLLKSDSATKDLFLTTYSVVALRIIDIVGSVIEKKEPIVDHPQFKSLPECVEFYKFTRNT